MTATETLQLSERARQADEKRDTLRKARLKTELQQAFRNFCEDYEAGSYSAEKALEAIADEVYSWARESGSFHQQERLQMCAIISRCAGEVGACE
jgi:hypothetical protein